MPSRGIQPERDGGVYGLFIVIAVVAGGALLVLLACAVLALLTAGGAMNPLGATATP